MAKYTILIKGNVQNANAFQGYFVGMSTPNTAISFAEHMKLGILKSLKESDPSMFEDYDTNHPINSFDYIEVQDVIYGFDGSNFTLHGGHEKFVSSMKGNYDINPPIVDNKTYSSDFFVAFNLYFKGSISNFDTDSLKEILYNTVNMSKFSGGKVFNAFKDNIYVVTQNELKTEFNGLSGLLKHVLKRGLSAWFFVEQFSENYRNAFEQNEEYKKLNDLEKILYVVKRDRPSTRKEKKHKTYDPILDGYYVPMTLGYRFLSKLVDAQDKFKFKNSYSEPLLGIVRCRSLDSFLHDPVYEIVWNNEFHQDSVLTVAKSIN